ncbi:MAG: hypothetical protein LAO23_11870 [Acidobacteriia bacterium]|nr:hypothetical protein [Terriglobia bacterium]
MKIIGITSTALLSLLLGLAAPVYGQHEQQGEKQDHPAQQQGKHEQAKPEQQHARQQQQTEQKQQQPQRAQQQQQNKQTRQRAQQQQKNENKQSQQRAQQQQKNENKQSQQRAQRQQQGDQRPQRTQEQQRVHQSAWQQHRSQHWDSDHRSWQQRGGYHGYRIPEDRFRGYFGPDHGFRIYGLPFLVVGGYPRFQYQGYWISLVDPWPEYWGNDWYDNDDVYVTYVDNGYYLFNRRYPNVGIAISISM